MAATVPDGKAQDRARRLLLPAVAGGVVGAAAGAARADMPWPLTFGIVGVAVLSAVWLAWRWRHWSPPPVVVGRVGRWLAEIDASLPTEDVAARALDVARDIAGTRRAEMVLFREGVGWRLRHVGALRDPGWHSLSEPLALAGFQANLADGDIPRRLDRRRLFESADDARLRAELLDGATGPALIVPVHGSAARGTLLVAEPVERWFAPHAEANLQLLAAHLGGQLDASLASEQARNAAARLLATDSTDELTGLPGRPVFVQRVDEAARMSTAALPVAVLLVNLDGFREINATFGHRVGDDLLRQFGARLRDCLPVTATVSRLGGDEFAVLLCELRDEESAVALAGELLQDLTSPYPVGDASVQVDASIGVALAPTHARTATRLLQHADIAMEAAKSAHNGVEVYDASKGTPASGSLTLLGELRRAIDDDHLQLVYQPKAALRSRSVNGAEALIRWTDEVRGRMSPADFIPLAERTGLIHPLTRWVIRAVLEQQRAWLADGVALEVAVNLSARNLMDQTLASDVADLLAEYRTPPELLRFEITESSIIVDPGRAEVILADLHQLGISMSVDDFGTGYSSLAHLLRLPVDEIKIDQSFVAGLLTRRSEAAIVRATIDLGRRLAMTVTAEGVEDRETWDKLAELGCDQGQGYWFARPMTAAALTTWLPERRIATRRDGDADPRTVARNGRSPAPAARNGSTPESAAGNGNTPQPAAGVGDPDGQGTASGAASHGGRPTSA